MSIGLLRRDRDRHSYGAAGSSQPRGSRLSNEEFRGDHTHLTSTKATTFTSVCLGTWGLLSFR